MKRECVGVLEAGEGDSGVGVVIARVKDKTAETLCGIETSRPGPGFWRAESLRRARPHPVPALFTKAQYRGHLHSTAFFRETFAGPTCTGLGYTSSLPVHGAMQGWMEEESVGFRVCS